MTWRDARFPVAVAAVSRLFVLTVAVVAQAAKSTTGTSPPLAWAFAHWDAGHYLRIASSGYQIPSDWAFEPGYPMAVAAFHWVWPGGVTSAAVVLSTLLAIPGLWAVGGLAEDLLGRAWGRRVVVLAAFSPTSFYLSTAYAEALFLVLAAGCLWALHRRRFWVAAILAAAAGVVRPTGILLWPMVAIGLAFAAPKARRAWASLAILPLPWLAFQLYAAHRTGDFFVVGHTREALWPNVRLHIPWHLQFAADVTVAQRLVCIVAMVVAAASALWAMRKAWQRWPQSRTWVPVVLLSAILAAIEWIYAEPTPALRYSEPVFVMYWALSVSPRRWLFYSLTAASAAGLAVVTVLFALTRAPIY
ncbi:MAG: mannosyltransferase family protein [Thermoplasmatota archaeon]